MANVKKVIEYPKPDNIETTYTFPWYVFSDKKVAEEAAEAAVNNAEVKNLIWPVDSPEQPGAFQTVIGSDGSKVYKVCCP
jgi:hypothetical protein